MQNSIAATDTTHIFFIGNSFTYVFDVPGVVKGFADLAGKSMYYEQHTPGGISVGDIDQGTSAHWQNPAVFNGLRKGIWDFVVLQDNQGRFVLGHHKFPSVAKSRVVDGHIKIRDSMRYYNPCASMVLFAGWAFQGGYMPYSPTGIGLIDTVAINYAFLNDSMHEVVSPIGVAWRRVIETMPAVNLWGPDSAHQSEAGTYLTAAVLYSTIFRSSPVELDYMVAGVDSATARALRTIAWQAVSDSVVPNHLTKVTIPVSVSGTVLTAGSGYSSLQWYRNDTLIPGASGATYTGTGGACYSVSGVDAGGCPCSSMPVCDIADPSLVPVLSKGVFSMYPNPVAGDLYVELESAGATVIVADIRGREMSHIVGCDRTVTISTGSWKTGIYIVSVITGNSVYREKIAVQH